MSEHVVNCGCGRTMNVDAPRGRGAYRCGCGTRVKVAGAPPRAVVCSVTGCRSVSMTGEKMRLCDEHKAEAVMVLAVDLGRLDMRHLAELHRSGATRYVTPVIPVYEGPRVAITDSAKVVRHLPLDGPHDSVVYFLQNGTMVKIGYTGNLKSRLVSLSLRPQNVRLLLEGGQKLEYDLHARFLAHRVADTEWFTLCDEIEEFITARPQVGRKNGAPRRVPPPLPPR